MTDGQLRRLFTSCLGKLIVYGTSLPGYELQVEEVYINPVRLYKGKKQTLTQAQYVHNLAGLHPKGRAADISLFVYGEWIKFSSHPAWTPLIKYWLSLHPYCKSGISGDDANHFSLDPGTKW